MLKSDDIRATTFRRVRWRAGYDIAEVDAFLVDLAFALDTHTEMVPADITNVHFARSRFGAGYQKSEVDAFLKRTRRALL